MSQLHCALLAGTVAAVTACSSHRTPVTLRELYGLRAPPSIEADRTALVFVDYQQEFVSGALQLPEVIPAVERAEQLLLWARRNGVAVVHVQNVLSRPDAPFFRSGTSGVEFIPSLAAQPGELVVQKAMAGGFTKTELDSLLRTRGIEQLIIGGLMTHLAVDTTARDATVLGYRVIVASDATATRDLPGVEHALLQRAALASLSDRFADVMTVDSICALEVRANSGTR